MNDQSKDVIVKVLYTFDDRTSFLARSQTPIRARVFTIPQSQQQIACIEIKSCIALVQFSSPEWFQKGSDYSIYYKDIMETDEPYVGFGLCSKILKDKKSQPQFVTGHLSTNFMSLLNNNGGISDTLEIKLRFCQIPTQSSSSSSRKKLNSSPSSSSDLQQQQQVQQQRQQQQQQQLKGSSSPPFDDFNEPILKRKYKRQQSISAASSAPIMASRTQSLPFFDENSLAHKIRLADKSSSNAPSNDKDVHSRFQIGSNQPTKAKKTKSFIQSIVKIGDTTINDSQQCNKCINCSITNQPPYKYHKEGIFHFGNSGFLCSICNKFKITNDIKKLRERGELGANGLLNGPYSSSSKTLNKKRRRTTDQSSPLISSSSSPIINNYKKSKGNSSSNSSNKLINNFPLINSSKDNTPADLFDITNILNLNLERDDFISANTFQSNKKFFVDYDNHPLGATKLNTTLIQFDEDDQKENQRPMQLPLQKHTISPSIQRIIESFSEAAAAAAAADNNENPQSPSGTHNQEWNYDFFHNQNTTGGAIEDDEINRILNNAGTTTSSSSNNNNNNQVNNNNNTNSNQVIAKRTPHQQMPAVEVTPKDADTVQTSNDDSPQTNNNTTTNLTVKPMMKVNMPSSPFFSIPEHSNENEEDETRSMPWERSSPTTELSLTTK